MIRAKLARTARRDLEDFRKYIVARRGRDQWFRYVAGPSEAFQRIAHDPQSGRQRNRLLLGLRSLTFGQPVIFFSPVGHAGGSPVIVRIIHQRRNLWALSFTEDREG